MPLLFSPQRWRTFSITSAVGGGGACHGLLQHLVFLLSIASLVHMSSSFSTSRTRPACRFITNEMCPFAQKAWIALEAAKANYKLEQVSLYGPGGKPDWFWKLNPKGEVPIVVLLGEGGKDETVLADSDLILDEIGQVTDDESQLVTSNQDENGNEIEKKVQAFRTSLREFLPVGKQAVLGGDKKKMWAKLQELDALIAGPFIAGEQLTIADCAGFPFLWRIDQEYGSWEDHGCDNIPKWLKECSQLPAFGNSVQQSWWWWW